MYNDFLLSDVLGDGTVRVRVGVRVRLNFRVIGRVRVRCRSNEGLLHRHNHV